MYIHVCVRACMCSAVCECVNAFPFSHVYALTFFVYIHVCVCSRTLVTGRVYICVYMCVGICVCVRADLCVCSNRREGKVGDR